MFDYRGSIPLGPSVAIYPRQAEHTSKAVRSLPGAQDIEAAPPLSVDFIDDLQVALEAGSDLTVGASRAGDAALEKALARMKTAEGRYLIDVLRDEKRYRAHRNFEDLHQEIFNASRDHNLERLSDCLQEIFQFEADSAPGAVKRSEAVVLASILRNAIEAEIEGSFDSSPPSLASKPSAGQTLEGSAIVKKYEEPSAKSPRSAHSVNRFAQIGIGRVRLRAFDSAFAYFCARSYGSTPTEEQQEKYDLESFPNADEIGREAEKLRETF